MICVLSVLFVCEWIVFIFFYFVYFVPSASLNRDEQRRKKKGKKKQRIKVERIRSVCSSLQKLANYRSGTKLFRKKNDWWWQIRRAKSKFTNEKKKCEKKQIFEVLYWNWVMWIVRGSWWKWAHVKHTKIHIFRVAGLKFIFFFFRFFPFLFILITFLKCSGYFIAPHWTICRILFPPAPVSDPNLAPSKHRPFSLRSDLIENEWNIR